jgi:hypothetical protein
MPREGRARHARLLKQGDFGSRAIFAAPGLRQSDGGLFSAPGRRETNRWQEFAGKRRARVLPEKRRRAPFGAKAGGEKIATGVKFASAGEAA